MADGDIKDRIVDGFTQVALIDSAVATDNGVWFDCGPYELASIHIFASDGTFNATVTVNASNRVSKPAATDHDVVRGSITADQSEYTTQIVPRWLKARVSVWTSGTIEVVMVLRRRRR